MSKFCGNCGTVMDDAAMVCGQCGAPLAASANVNTGTQKKAVKFDASAITGVIDGIKKGDKGALIKGGAAVAAVAVVFILIISIFAGNGAEKTAEKFIKAFDKEKAESMVKLLPKFCFGETENGFEKDEEEWQDEFEKTIEDFKDSMDSEYDFDEFSIKYELLYSENYGKEYLKDIEDDFEEFKDFEEKKLKDAADLVYEVVYKGKGEKVIGKASFTVVKYGSKWYIYDFAFSRSSVQNDEKPEYNYYY